MQNAPQKTKVTYLFDPLCGWCYGASPVVQRLGEHVGIELELAPTGLFAEKGARAMDAAFADYAWSNDMRIEKLTGQRFTADYRKNVLGHPGTRFDSAATTLALTAASLSEPEREHETLMILQEARYVHGLDTSAAPVVVKVLKGMGLGTAADRLAAADAGLLAANLARLQKAQVLMQALGAQGVPALVVTAPGGRGLLRGDELYGSFDKLLVQITLQASAS